MLLALLSSVFLTLIIAYLIIKIYSDRFRTDGIPGSKLYFPFGNAWWSTMKKRNMAFDIDDVYQQFKDKSPISTFFSLFSTYIVATDPELIKQILVKDFHKFRNNDLTVHPIKDLVMAHSPFWMKDDAWKERRSEITPAMTNLKLKAIYPCIVVGTKSLTDYISRELLKDSATAFNSFDISSKYTCDTSASFTYGVDAGSFTSDNPVILRKAQQAAISISANTDQSLFSGPLLSKESEKFFVEVAEEAIRCRSETNAIHDDFLTYELALKEKKNFDDFEIACRLATFFIDAYDASGMVLHHALYEIGCNKRIQDKLRKEINEAFGEEEHFISYQALLELPYLDQVFYEVIRRNPPGVSSIRVASEDVEVRGFKDKKMLIRKGQAVWIPIMSIQKNPEYYPNPEEFIPERFDPEHGGVKAFKDRGIMLAFGNGQRMCLGIKFSHMQIKAAIVAVLKDFEISIDKQTPRREDLKMALGVFANMYTENLMLNFKQI